MPRFSNESIITSIQNGDENILFYLTDKYFQSSRRWLRRNGCRDSETPQLFSTVLLKVYREIQQPNISTNVDFDKYFLNSLKEELNQWKQADSDSVNNEVEEKKLVMACYSILDDASRKLLQNRFISRKSFEQISVDSNFSNPVIAEYEVNKAYHLFENIVKARLNIGRKENL